jgi:3-oxoacyl-[acyl-carrier protein] reductase
MKKIQDFKIGTKASFLVTITQEMVEQFVALTGDDNPVHVDPEYAREVRLGRPVVHGMLSASFVSTLVGKHLPGEGALWVSQDFQFLKPVQVGDVLEFIAVVAKVHEKMNLLTLDITVSNERGVNVLTGKGMVKSLADKVQPKTEAEDSTAISGAVLITGASGTIGSTVARVLAANGIPVILQFQRNRNSVDALAREIVELGGEAHCLQADLRLQSEVLKLASASMGFGQPVRGLVHCASLPIHSTAIDQLEWTDISEHIDVAGKSFYLLIKSLMPALIESGGASVVAVSTQAIEETPAKGWLSYLVGKNVLSSIVRSVAVEFGPDGVRANIVSPGMVDSELVSDIPERVKLTVKQNTPVRRLCEPSDVADAVHFLISEKSGFISGETIRVNGGILMR